MSTSGCWPGRWGAAGLRLAGRHSWWWHTGGPWGWGEAAPCLHAALWRGVPPYARRSRGGPRRASDGRWGRADHRIALQRRALYKRGACAHLRQEKGGLLHSSQHAAGSGCRAIRCDAEYQTRRTGPEDLGSALDASQGSQIARLSHESRLLRQGSCSGSRRASTGPAPPLFRLAAALASPKHRASSRGRIRDRTCLTAKASDNKQGSHPSCRGECFSIGTPSGTHHHHHPVAGLE